VAARLEAARTELDALNVFPVPDGDTGTNLALTVGGAVAEAGDDLARSLLVHARGNSGVIASQLVRGWADVLTVRGRAAVPGAPAGPDAGAGGDLVAKALRRGDELAWAAVTDPVEGTVLSVSRAAADAAEQAASAGAGLHGVVLAVVAAAEEALGRTPEQLPALAAAGVVDAGGAGLLLALQALRDVVEGAVDDDAWAEAPSRAGQLSGMGVAGVDLDPSGPAYEVMYLLTAEDADRVMALRAELQALGDSVLVVGGGGLWHVHVHTDDPGAAVEAGIVAGRPSTVRITHFAAAAAAAAARPGPAAPDPPAQHRRVALAVVACAAGRATEELCRAAGATVVPSAPGARASTGDVLRAVLRAGAGARRVLVLPNDGETAAVAHQAVLAAEEDGVAAVVARSRSQVQVLAALAVLEGGQADDDAVAALRTAAAAVEGCRYGAVAVAGRASSTPVGPCDVGDLVGTVGREVVAVGTDAVEVAAQVVARLGAGTELVTVLPGEDGAEAAEALRERLAAAGGVAVDVLGGGQPRYLLLLGCE
jgi:DAK2 domain fusion protein YloV